MGPVSGAHLNPIVTLADRLLGGIGAGDATAYVGAQVTGGALANLAKVACLQGNHITYLVPYTHGIQW